MKIMPITNQFNNSQSLKCAQKREMVCISDSQNVNLPNIYYFHHFQVNFKGLNAVESLAKKVVKKGAYGNDIFTDGFVDISKIGSDKLTQAKIDILKASKTEITQWYYANALAEFKESSWGSRFNPFNSTKHLATPHTLMSSTSKKIFTSNRIKLTNYSKYSELDIPILNEKGKLNFNFVGFDTETTGVKTEGEPAEWDKIIQIGALKVQKGKVVEEYNTLVNPEKPIAEGASAVNGITNLMVKDAKTIEQILPGFINNILSIKNGVIVAYNSKFDMTLLNKAIRDRNIFASENIEERPLHKVLDPFILIQRIHPYLGVKKKLADQYRWLFLKDMENAHDALCDVKGTIDILKYCLYFLDKHRVNKNIPLSLREVLAFQNGHKIANTDIIFDAEGANKAWKFKKSYVLFPLNLTNYHKGYNIPEEALNGLKDDIGQENVQKLKKAGIINSLIELKTAKGLPINPAETKINPKTGKYQTIGYTLLSNFKKILKIAKIDDYNGKTKQEIEDLIISKSKVYYKDFSPKNGVWLKNVDLKDIPSGNDMPDIEIARKVVREYQEG